MKTFIFGACTFFASILFVQNTSAQDNRATFENYLKKVYDAYQSGDDNAMWAFYTDQAAEITPDGNLSTGKAALKASWDQFMQMVDSRPTFTYALTSWRLITPDVALITWKSNSDIKMNGQQVGGPSTCSAVMHKINGEWKIECDTMTPVMQMPTDN